MTDKCEINVFFRKWVDDDGAEVIAIWEDSETSDMLNSYQHIGQHSDAHFDLINELDPAEPFEYADLKRELEQHCGYTVNVMAQRHFSIFQN